MTDIPDEAVDATVPEKAYIAAEDALRSDMWDGDPENIPPNMRTEAELAVDAAAPIIRADERRRVAEEIRASSIGDPVSIEDCQRHEPDVCNICYGRELAAQISERSGQ